MRTDEGFDMSTDLAYGKPVHRDERLRMAPFKLLPSAEIGGWIRGRKDLAELIEHAGRQTEAEKLKSVFRQKSRDPRNIKSMLHYVKQQIAASAHVVEVRAGHEFI